MHEERRRGGDHEGAAEEEATILDIYVGRQPIYDAGLDVIGYELLFRNYGADSAEFVDSDRATSHVILNTFMEIGLDRLVGNGSAFINLTRSFVLEQHPLPLPKRHVVLEVLEDITIDEKLVGAVRSLADRGYQVALDDVVHPDLVEPLLDIVHIVKLDLMGMDQAHLAEYVSKLRRYDLKLLAEKVETREEFNRCKALGFDYFQGYFLSKPSVVQGQKIPAARLNILRLLATLQAADVEFHKLEEIVRQDVSLTYRLLRLINSALYAKPKDIHSIGQALTYLGIRQTRAWLSLLLLSQVDDKPSELIRIGMVRAKMCELLALDLKEGKAGPDFTVGLFSVLDAIFERPMEEILASLPLSGEIKAALLRHEGPMGAVLRCTLAYEWGNWDGTAKLGFDPSVVRRAYLASLHWADTVISSLAT